MDIKLCLVILLLSQPLLMLSDVHLKDKYFNCRSDSQKSLREVVEDLSDRRDDRDNVYFDEYRRTSRYFNDHDNDDLIKSSKGGTGTIIAFLIVTFILLILILLVLIKVIKPKSNKVLLGLAILMWLIYSSFFWASFAT